MREEEESARSKRYFFFFFTINLLKWCSRTRHCKYRNERKFITFRSKATKRIGDKVFGFILKLKPHYIHNNYATLSRGPQRGYYRGRVEIRRRRYFIYEVRLGSNSTPNLALQEQRTRELNIFQHKKRDFVSSSVHVMFYLLYQHLWNTIPFHFRCEGRHFVCNHSNDDFHVWRYLVFTRKLTWYFTGL